MAFSAAVLWILWMITFLASLLALSLVSSTMAFTCAIDSVLALFTNPSISCSLASSADNREICSSLVICSACDLSSSVCFLCNTSFWRSKLAFKSSNSLSWLPARSNLLESDWFLDLSFFSSSSILRSRFLISCLCWSLSFRKCSFASIILSFLADSPRRLASLTILSASFWAFSSSSFAFSSCWWTFALKMNLPSTTPTINPKIPIPIIIPISTCQYLIWINIESCWW